MMELRQAEAGYLYPVGSNRDRRRFWERWQALGLPLPDAKTGKCGIVSAVYRHQPRPRYRRAA